MDSLKLTPRTTQGSCGIYEAGDPKKTNTLLFVTNGGRVISVNHRQISQDDLMDAYNWGRLEEREANWV